MDDQSFFDRLDILEKFSDEKKKRKYLSQCDDLTIHCLSELCFNLLRKEKEIPLNKRTIKKLLPLRDILHRLSKSTGSIKNKRKHLTEIANVLCPIMKKSIIPALNKI